MQKKTSRRLLAFVIIFIILFIAFKPTLNFLGQSLIRNDTITQADAVVVLTTGVNYYPRLIEAARLYKGNIVTKVIINGDRKSDVLRKIENMGYKPPCAWSEHIIQILETLGVARDDIIAIAAEDAFDTISEAQIVGKALINHGINNIMIATSKFHTRRAAYIWETLYPGELKIAMVAAQDDPFDPESWWKSGRQIRDVLAEYGGWFYYYWQS